MSNRVEVDFGEQFEFLVDDAKRHFGQWDCCDPCAWAIIKLVQAQNDLASAIDVTVNYGVDDRVVEEAAAARRKAIAALQETVERSDRQLF